MEGGFKANVLLLSIAGSQCRGVHTLVAGEEIIHRYFRCHISVCRLMQYFLCPRSKRESHYLGSSKENLTLHFISFQTVVQ